MQKSTVSSSSVEQLLRQRLGEVTHLHQLTEGLASQAFGFRHDGSEYVIRIKSWLGGFQKDAFVSRTFASAHLPIPEVITVDRFDHDLAFCLSRRAPGMRLHDLDTAEMRAVTGPTAEIMRTIAEADVSGTTGFGRFDASGMGPYCTWRAFLLGMGDAQRHDWQAHASQVDLDVVNRLLQAVEQLSEHCPEERHLVHGDFGSYNVLTDGTRITALIDWDLALFGDPLYEVANVLFWREDHLEPLLQHLEALPSEAPGDRARLACYQLRIGLQELFDSAVGANPVSTEWLTTRCLDVLNRVQETVGNLRGA